MDFEFSDDQVSLRDAVAKWVEKGFDFPRRHALAKAGGFSRAVYGELADLGLTGLVVPEAEGGMGFGPVEAMVVMEELGRGLVNAPYAAAALVAPTLLDAGPTDLQASVLPRIATGEALVVPALQERASRYRQQHVTTTAVPQADLWSLTGQKSVVPAADEADEFIVSARISGAADDTAGIGLFLVQKTAPGVTVKGYPTQDGGRAGELMLNGATATLITADGWAALERATDFGIAASCAEGVGLMDKMVAITIEYMNTRKQFGTTLASFQALRHRIADVKMQQELGRSMSFYATLKMGEPAAARRRALSQAKVQLGNSMRYVGQQCTQIHGGIGVTDEYISSHYFKRLTMLEMAYGDTLHHLGEVSARMQDTAGVFA
jgi:alkylation response protein AidB-like acyl-CoA dehydrogenase